MMSSFRWRDKDVGNEFVAIRGLVLGVLTSATYIPIGTEILRMAHPQMPAIGPSSDLFSPPMGYFLVWLGAALVIALPGLVLLFSRALRMSAAIYVATAIVCCGILYYLIFNIDTSYFVSLPRLTTVT
ncbi:hypothetical protein [Williamsia sp. CHRR-6]|uniref:hypothetical protein n=1 Tax=Williamsia sp. CHRR-6 TaxID=2835871 RepID=UPI001BD94261|nr:hypothetical protein [Williamsia sp. CHRR-6]MBT0567334.1 hypothetical protein [Williamsia sp. CHRR-6]